MADDNFDLEDGTLLEIKRSPDREIATPVSNAVNMDSQTPTLSKSKSQAKQSGKKQEDRSLPNDIRRGFYIHTDNVGHRHIYADSQGKREIFQENGDKLRTKNNDIHAVSLMLDTAAHRGWASIHAKGTKEFCREAWLEGQARGMIVTGYKPTELDLQVLKKRENAYLRHEKTSRDRIGNKTSQTETAQPLNDHNHHDREKTSYRDGVKGVLIEQGQRPYQDNPNKDDSPYVVLQDEKGSRKTIWGVGLPEAMLKAGANRGDHIRIREAGMEPVTRNILRKINGQTTCVAYQFQRRSWEVEVIKEHVTNQEILQQAQQQNLPTQDKEPHENSANREVSRDIASTQHTLHVGPGRDVALEEGVYANEARAKAYLAGGRIAAGRMPELKNAAAIEAYLERKIKQKYPHDPVLLQRVMQTARNRIGHAIARGFDFPQPRIIDKKELENAQGNQKHNKQQDAKDAKIENEQSQKREQNRERDKDKNRQ